MNQMGAHSGFMIVMLRSMGFKLKTCAEAAMHWADTIDREKVPSHITGYNKTLDSQVDKGSDPEPGGPPEHWLRRINNGPPPHWIDHVRKNLTRTATPSHSKEYHTVASKSSSTNPHTHT